MEFTFSAEQEALREAVRSFMAREDARAVARHLEDDPDGVPPELWAKLVELGWHALLVPERNGGLGLGMVDLVVVLEEMGRVPFAGPFLSSAVFATLAARALGLDEQLEGLAAGGARGTIALDEAGHGDVVDRIRTRASRKSGRWLLDGHKPVVLDGHTADWALVPARTQEGLTTFLVREPAGVLVPAWDVTRRVASLDLAGRHAEPVGPVGDHTAIWRRVVDDACVALCAELIGVGESALDLGIEYAKAREQFGRPIATFQVIKHKAVDMLHRVELARVGTHFAAWASDVDDPQRAESAAMAKAFVPEAINEVCAECIQIHGGVGFSWECDAHLFYRRAKQNDLLLGYHGIHRERVADLYLDAV